MDTMKKFNPSLIDYYYEQMISFKGKDIERWCNNNVDSEDFSLRYISQMLYKYYFEEDNKMKPNPDYYYYILYNEYGNNFIKLRRDKVLSPKTKYSIRGAEAIEKMEQKIDNLESDIKADSRYTNFELDTINQLRGITERRLLFITGKPYIDYKTYHKLSNIEKIECYCTFKYHYENLQTLQFIMESVIE